MAHISEILSLARFDSSADQNKDNKSTKHYKYYGAVRKLPKESSDNDDDNLISEDVWQEHDRREGEDRRSTGKKRNKRFELRNKNDRRKTKSLSIKA